MTAIKNDAFSGYASIESVKIPDSVSFVGVNAFRDTNAIEIEDGVHYVDKWAVRLKDGASAVSIREGTVGIGEEAFAYSGISSVAISDSVKYICDLAFYYCNNLASFNLPKSLISIGENAFARCRKFDCRLVIPDGTEIIGSAAFYASGNITDVTIPDSVKYIGAAAFKHCPCIEYENGIGYADKWVVETERITVADIRTGTVGIAEKAFTDGTLNLIILSNLGKVIIPDSLLYICSEAFDKNWGIHTFTVGENNPAFKVVNGDLYSKDGTSLIKCATRNNRQSFTIPEGTVTLDNYALFRAGGFAFENITIPSSVKSIGCNTFAACTKLTSVTFESAEGWVIRNMDTGEITPLDVTNPQANAEKLTSYSEDDRFVIEKR